MTKEQHAEKVERILIELVINGRYSVADAKRDILALEAPDQ